MTMNMKNIKAVIFDLDGTLIDTEKYYRQFWPKACAACGYTLTDEMMLSLRSLGRPFAPARLKQWFGEDFDYKKVRQIRMEMMEECIRTEGIQVKPGARELIQFLKEQGIVTAIATATDPERTERYLKLTGLDDLFDKIISATMVKTGKPAPDVYQYACEQIGFHPEECIAVEDAPNGILSAYIAGLHVICVPDQTPVGPDLKYYLFAECETLLGVKKLFEE